MQTPAQRYQRGERTYQPQVVPWQYPETLKVVRVDANGMIRWEGHRHFACEALVHHLVAVEQIGGELLVRFRNMYIRQIDLKTNHTLPFIHPVGELL